MAANDYEVKFQECGAARTAFSIDMIVQCVFQNLKTNFEDVKTLRLISPTCNKMLLSYFSANSKISNHKLSLRAKSSGISATFDSLKHSFASSQKFPCSSIEVGGLWKLENPGVMSFLDSYGQNINHLTLTRTVVPLDIDYFQALLLYWLPSLNTLNIRSWTFEDSRQIRKQIGTSRFLSKSKSLKNLKMLTFGPTDRQILKLPQLEMIIFEDILLASPNLEILNLCQMQLLETVVHTQKVDKLKILKLYFPEIIIPSVYKEFISHAPKLKEIEFSVRSLVASDSSGMNDFKAEIVSSILASSKDSLETITIATQNVSQTFTSMLQLNLPVLSNVKEMNLADLYLLNCTIQGRCNISDALPALRNVRINARILGQVHGCETLGEHFFEEFYEVMSSVRRLEIQTRYITKALMVKMAEIFPKVQSVKLLWWGESRDTILWMLPTEVKEIQLWDFSLKNYQDLKFESLFTGIPQEVCQGLKETSRNLVRFEGLSESPSIRSLKKLVSLKFYCKDFPFDAPSDGRGYFSNLTKWLILEPMAELQLQLAFPQVVAKGNDIFNVTLAEHPHFPPISERLVISYFDDRRKWSK